MQPTYYERVLADRHLNLAGVLDQDIAQLTLEGALLPIGGNTSLADCRDRYIKSAIAGFKRDLAAGMSTEQFERYQQTPAFHELLVQKATQQYWTYETFLYLRAHGERTLHIGAEASAELLAAPLETLGRDFQLEVPAAMLVFESAEMVDAFYAGERRNGTGRVHQEAPVCVLALETHPQPVSSVRYLRVLSVHGDSAKDYRVEIRQFSIADRVELEDILENEEASAWRGGETVEQLLGLPACTLSYASRKADCGFYAARTPFYRAVLGALHIARTSPQCLKWHAQTAPVNGTVSRLGYNELLPGGR
jgi:hypothetical protein